MLEFKLKEIGQSNNKNKITKFIGAKNKTNQIEKIQLLIFIINI